jgi:hypothetical protein
MTTPARRRRPKRPIGPQPPLGGRHSWRAITDRWKAEMALADDLVADRNGLGLETFFDDHGCQRCVYALLVRYQECTLKEVQDAYDRWMDPSTRRPDRYHCTEHDATLKAGMSFRAMYGMLAFPGHVAWAYEIDPWQRAYEKKVNGKDQPYRVGSLYFTVDPDDVNDAVFTSLMDDETDDPLGYFKEHGYVAFTWLEAPDDNYEGAILQSMLAYRKLSEDGYRVFGRNCLDMAVRILTTFGVPNLDPPWVNEVPANYFRDLPGEAVELNPPFEPKNPHDKVMP